MIKQINFIKSARQPEFTKFHRPCSIALPALGSLGSKMAKVESKLAFLFQIWKRRNDPAPFFAILVLNSKCNGNCSYCYMKESTREEIELPLDRVLTTIDELAKVGCLEVTFHGGEALLREDLGQIIEHAKNRRLITHLVTNGQLLAERINEIQRVDSVSISLDGGRDFNDRVKGLPGYFDKALEGLDILKSRGIKTSINCLILPGTLGELPYLLELAKSRRLGLQFLPDINRLMGRRDINQRYRDELLEILESLLEHKGRGYPILASRKALKRGINWILEKDRYLLAPAPHCTAGFKSVIVDYDGYVLPCFGFNDQKRISITDLDVVDAMKKIRENHDCDFCINFPYIDQTAIMHFDWSVILEYGWSVLRGLR